MTSSGYDGSFQSFVHVYVITILVVLLSIVSLINNEKLDTSFIGIPKEPVGLSNYDGKGIPGKFKKHKFTVSENLTVNIPLKKL